MDSNKSDTSQSKEQLASHYALHVALQTMKERCLALQQRLTLVEQENSTLRRKLGQDQPNKGNTHIDESNEIEALREQVGELTRQKYQLNEHIGMVALENRQLWLRLSKLTKDNQTLGVSLNKIKSTLTEGSNHQNLIRSKTFTQNSPNPILRQKMMQDSGIMHDNGKEMQDDASLEEIPLKGHADQALLYGELNMQLANDEFVNRTTTAANSMGFGYLNDDSINTILMNDTKKCLDSMVDIKKELLRQQSDLKVALSGLRQRRVLEACLNCKNQSAKKANMADKNLGTDEIHDFFQDHINEPSSHHRRESSENDAEIAGIIGNGAAAYYPIKTDPNAMDITQQKRIADYMDKMCPMCGKIYSDELSFEIFQDHVESHFIDETDLDLSVEKNFEFVSNTVGQF